MLSMVECVACSFVLAHFLSRLAFYNSTRCVCVFLSSCLVLGARCERSHTHSTLLFHRIVANPHRYVALPAILHKVLGDSNVSRNFGEMKDLIKGLVDT